MTNTKDIIIDEIEAKIAYATLRLQNDSVATQEGIAKFVDASVSTVCRRLKERLISAGVIKRVHAHQRHATYVYKIDTDKEIDNQDSAIIALEILEFPKDKKQNTLNEIDLIDHIIRTGKLKLIALTASAIKEKLKELDHQGLYIELLGGSIKVLPKIRDHLNYIHLVANQPERDQLKSYQFPIVSEWNIEGLAKAREIRTKKLSNKD